MLLYIKTIYGIWQAIIESIDPTWANVLNPELKRITINPTFRYQEKHIINVCERFKPKMFLKMLYKFIDLYQLLSNISWYGPVPPVNMLVSLKGWHTHAMLAGAAKVGSNTIKIWKYHETSSEWNQRDILTNSFQKNFTIQHCQTLSHQCWLRCIFTDHWNKATC